ncbi:MAG: hypothetical protein EOS10_31035 [Mesorhizobium sp.]|uniref:hypothetical protein n=1 Tax=Mesorhizobium sp. TaxID=1871066 RepID=UPI000FEA2DC1|nr:hypothetical protein [Mesorhizobium sp.]RWO25257.1 MAG: hypothetical protein EOS10_31035 [Mesorhizobium sp.]
MHVVLRNTARFAFMKKHACVGNCLQANGGIGPVDFLAANRASRIDASGSGRAVWLLKCKAEGRDRRPVFFTFIPDDKCQQRERNRTWKPTFESEGLETREPFIREPLCVHVPSRATTHLAKG